MGKKKKVDAVPGEQMALIDVGPENLAAITPVAKRYQAAQQRRAKALKEETAAKEEILALIKDAGLNRLEDGSIRFRCDGMLISVTPRDELVRVKEDNDGE